MTTLKRVSLSLALLAVFSTAMMAQVTAGTILGNVRDASGAAVADTAISIKEINKGTVQTYKTDENGGFYAPFLTPGTYQVSVEKAGFKKQASQNFDLQVDQKARVDFTLQVGAGHASRSR